MRCRRCMIWQRSAVNRRVAGSSPARGASNSLRREPFWSDERSRGRELVPILVPLWSCARAPHWLRKVATDARMRSMNVGFGLGRTSLSPV